MGVSNWSAALVRAVVAPGTAITRLRGGAQGAIVLLCEA